jgi:hypothetical protein
VTDAAPLAAVFLATRAGAEELLQSLVDGARAAGAHTVVVVLPREAPAPAEVRVARVAAGASTINALRSGMALLTNTTARLALIWPLDGAEVDDVPRIAALVEAARREGAAVTAFAHDDLDASPVIVARDAWLELVTLGEQGIGAVAARRGSYLVP